MKHLPGYLARIKSVYEKSEKYNPFVFFFGGFTWDSLTLKRIDQLVDNVLLLVYLLLLGVLIILSLMLSSNKIRHPLVLKYGHWIFPGVQFFLGGLLSAYVIFYFQSASLTKTALFFIILLLLLVANEFLDKKLSNPFLLLGLYFWASWSFFIFFVPVVAKEVSHATFITSGLLSLLLLATVLYILHRRQVWDERKKYLQAAILIVTLYTGLNLFYAFNFIPPVPLSLKWGGVYHHAARQPDGLFQLRFEQPPWFRFWQKSDRVFHYAAGDTVSCFTAVFAPTKLTTKIFHHWQRFSAKDKRWTSTDRLGFEIIGYRDGGYRGITRKQHIVAGKWRVDVETAERQLLSRIAFEVRPANSPVHLKTIFK